MQRIRILTCNARALGDQLDEILGAHGADVVALTGIEPAHALRIAAPRVMRAATQGWGVDDNAGLALLWKTSFAVGSLDRFDFGHLRQPCGAIRVTFPLDGRYVNVYCALLSSDQAVSAGQQIRMAALIDSASDPTLLACEGAVTQGGERWSRCAEVWTAAQRRVVSLSASADAGLTVQRAFGITAGSTASDDRSPRGPVWHCSEEFSVFETRSIAIAASPDTPVRTATVALRASAADENVAIAL